MRESENIDMGTQRLVEFFVERAVQTDICMELMIRLMALEIEDHGAAGARPLLEQAIWRAADRVLSVDELGSPEGEPEVTTPFCYCNDGESRSNMVETIAHTTEVKLWGQGASLKELEAFALRILEEEPFFARWPEDLGLVKCLRLNDGEVIPTRVALRRGLPMDEKQTCWLDIEGLEEEVELCWLTASELAVLLRSYFANDIG